MKKIQYWMLTAILVISGLALTACSSKNNAAKPETKVTTDYAGVYLDEDRTGNNLVITTDSAGGYYVSIDIYRLTSLDDGRAQDTADGLAFTATDASGQPIGGIITLSADTAIVTFTDSHWPLLPNGEAFIYVAAHDSASVSGQVSK